MGGGPEPNTMGLSLVPGKLEYGGGGGVARACDIALGVPCDNVTREDVEGAGAELYGDVTGGCPCVVRCPGLGL